MAADFQLLSHHEPSETEPLAYYRGSVYCEGCAETIHYNAPFQRLVARCECGQIHDVALDEYIGDYTDDEARDLAENGYDE